jgi:hypothetical protein
MLGENLESSNEPTILNLKFEKIIIHYLINQLTTST